MATGDRAAAKVAIFPRSGALERHGSWGGCAMSDQRQDGRATLQELFQVMRDPSLTAEEKVLWALYRSYERENRGAFCSVETLADHMSAGTRSVERYRAVLLSGDGERTSGGFLRRDRLRGPRPAEYRAVHPEAPPRVTDVGLPSSAMGGGGRGESSDLPPRTLPQTKVVLPQAS